MFTAGATAAFAGMVLTACGPKRLYEVPKHKLQGIHRGDGAQLQGAGSARTSRSPTRVRLPGVLFAYALDISRCIGCRRCVYACVEENNQSRDPQIQWIRVLSMEKEKGVDFAHADPYYDPPEVPEEGHFYVPVACQQCDNPPCTKVCPVGATWKEKDGIVVIDYDWCIGCRYCMAACPYGARHFNWTEPAIPDERDQPEHALPRQPPAAQGRGGEVHVLHPAHARRAAIPACVEVCPVGARKFGNLLDPEQRDPLHHRAQARVRPQGGTEHRAEVLLLLCDLRVQCSSIRLFSGFTRGSLQLILRGQPDVLDVARVPGRAHRLRRCWPTSHQVQHGLIVTAMRDQVSWGFYIGNFTFLVGVAAAAVVLVIPAYVYNWKPIREIVIFGELLAISAIIMCLLFVTGRHRPARPLLAPDPALRAPELPELHPGLGRAGAEPVPRC